MLAPLRRLGWSDISEENIKFLYKDIVKLDLTKPSIYTITVLYKFPDSVLNTKVLCGDRYTINEIIFEYIKSGYIALVIYDFEYDEIKQLQKIIMSDDQVFTNTRKYLNALTSPF